MACHDVEKKKLGPSFNDISAKYKMGLGCAKGDAEAMLTEGILKGSKGGSDAGAKDPARGRTGPFEVAGVLTV
jgi:cytochrome c551/c552